MNRKLFYILWKKVLIPNHLVSFLWGMCSRLDEQEALFTRVQKSTCAKVMPIAMHVMLGLAEWEIELNVSNEMHCICFFRRSKVTHTHARACAHMFVDILYSIFHMCGMINFIMGVIWICIDRIGSQIPIVVLKRHISNFGASRFLHSRKLCLLFIHAWTHTTQNDSG